MRLKKWVGTTTATVLVSSLILAGCGGNTKTGGNEGSSPKNTESAAPASKETVTLKAYFPGDKPVGFDDVLQAVNDKLKADNVGAALNINFLPWTDYGNAVSVKMSAGEDFDMYLDAPWISMNQMIEGNSLMELDAAVAERPSSKHPFPRKCGSITNSAEKLWGFRSVPPRASYMAF